MIDTFWECDSCQGLNIEAIHNFEIVAMPTDSYHNLSKSAI